MVVLDILIRLIMSSILLIIFFSIFVVKTEKKSDEFDGFSHSSKNTRSFDSERPSRGNRKPPQSIHELGLTSSREQKNIFEDMYAEENYLKQQEEERWKHQLEISLAYETLRVGKSIMLLDGGLPSYYTIKHIFKVMIDKDILIDESATTLLLFNEKTNITKSMTLFDIVKAYHNEELYFSDIHFEKTKQTI